MNDSQSSYHLLDSGEGYKLEKFGPYIIQRPAAQAVWKPFLPKKNWDQADASFTREPENRWLIKNKLPDSWTIKVSDIDFKISPTDFGHLGIFAEQDIFWLWVQQKLKEARQKLNRPPEVLNLFAYSGGMTLAAAKAGAKVCHLDASKGMVAWARENAQLNDLQNAPIRWIIDDVMKFLQRELRRGTRYDAIILDPPTFGRGSKGEIFKIEEAIQPLLQYCRELLSPTPLFLLLSCHSPGFSPIVLHNLLRQFLQGLPGKIDEGEMVLKGEKNVCQLPSGCFARWSALKDSHD